MKKYFSSAICSNGYISAYNTIYKKDTNSRVFIIYGGSDFERAVFFDRLVKNFKGYNLSVFNPFYDESPDGIYIENLDTYIISDSGFSRISPILSGIWEKYYPVTKDKNYPLDLRREILIYKAKENNCYKKACNLLKSASHIKEKIHTEFSVYLNDDKVINYVRRFCSRTLKNTNIKGAGTIRLLSSPTPLGIHTHYDTIFENCDNVIGIYDNSSFVGSIILGIIKDYATSEKIPFIMSPSYFANDIPQTLIFSNHNIAITVCDENHILPFEPQEKVNTSRFLTSDNILSSKKVDALLSIENRLLDDCVLNIYEGRDYRFKYNNLCRGYENTDEAIERANKLTNMIML